jgi:hypothetical protein
MSQTSFRICSSFMGLMGLLLVGGFAASQEVDVGYRDFAFPTNSVSRPTREKPESKLWFNDGVWWGILWSGDAETGAYHIHHLDRVAQEWVDTGTVVDTRLKSRADVLWDGTHLYVASHIFTNTGQPVTDPSDRGKLWRFSYDTETRAYSLDDGFPVDVTGGKSETLVLDKDSTGQLWVTYVESSQVMVNHSLNGDDHTWATPFVLPGANADVDTDDISSVIAYDGHIGIMWSRQTFNNLSEPTNDPNPQSGRVASDSDHLASITMNFAVHDDGDDPSAWTSTAIYTASGDDHINLKTFDGVVYAAMKEADNAKLIGLLVCDARSSGCSKKSDWTHYPVFNTKDNSGNSPQAELLASSQPNPTRPIVLIDTENRDLYVFVREEPFSHGAIYYKQTKLDAIDFDAGLGVPFIRSATFLTINDPTSTKQNLDSATGLVVLASDEDTFFYFHNDLALDPQ